MKKRSSSAEETLALMLNHDHISGWQREYKFARDVVGSHPGIRKRLKEHGLKDWRFDFAFTAHKIAVEVEGGGFTGGRHTRGAGFEDDLYKYGKAMELGWRVYRCSPRMIRNGTAVEAIKRLLAICE